jgi:hypothetical protein
MAVQYRFVADRVISWPVAVATAQDGGVVTKAEFNARFRMIGTAAHDALVDASKHDDAAPFGKTLMDAVWLGFDGVDGLSDDGPSARQALLSQPGVMVGLITSFYEAYNGKAHEKN